MVNSKQKHLQRFTSEGLGGAVLVCSVSPARADGTRLHVLRVNYPMGMSNVPEHILRTRDVAEARAHWTATIEKVERNGFRRSGDPETVTVD